MDKIISFKQYPCGKEEIDYSELFRGCSKGKRTLPVNVYLAEHKKYGNVLINTGCSHFLKKNLADFAKFSMSRRISFNHDDEICTHLSSEGRDPIIIKKVLLTQCTPECCGGLPMLPKYELISTAQVLSVLWLADKDDGIMPSTLPPAEIKKSAAGIFKGKSIMNEYFKWVFDVFGDGSILAVDLKGAVGAMAGFYLTEKKIFIAADAFVDKTALDEGLIPSDKLLKRVTYPDDYISVQATVRRLHKENPDISILFNH